MSSGSKPPPELSPDKQALIALRKMRARLEELERTRTEPIAVVGIACRFPGGADTPDAFWRLLDGEVDAVRDVPADRWDIDAYYDPDPDAPGKIYTRSGGFLDAVDRFDAQFFRLAPREAVSVDPQQRLLLEVGWEALEHAGIAPDRIVGSDTGVFVGISSSDYAQLLLQAAGASGPDTYFGTGNALSAAAGRLAYVFGFHGPSMAVDTACSSSLVALHLACQSLRARECGTALAGGVNAILTPSVTMNFCRARMLAADGRCKTFDAAANGYVRSEGCGVAVLKRLSDAIADNDRVLAVIRGSAVNQDGRSGGFTAPNELAQVSLIRKALAAAGVEPNRVSYIEAHGTGTSLGDPIEAHALAAAFAGRPADRPLLVGSVKTNIGHLEAAAGIASFIKVVLALQHRRIPRHLHFKSLNPHIALDGFPLVVASRAADWAIPDGTRVAGISSFGFSGTNAHVLVEEAPAPSEGGAVTGERPAHVLALSARDEAALRAVAGRYASSLGESDDALADICHTANAGRTHFDERLAIVAETREELASALTEFAGAGRCPGVVRGTRTSAPEIAFLFTGQGSQYAGMGKALYDTAPAFRHALDACDELLRGEIEQPLLSVLYPPPGVQSPIDATAYTQVTLFALEYALAELWRSWGVQPGAVLGHSVGELVAACVAGVFTLEEALRLVAARGRLMQELPAGGAMAAVRTDEAAVAALLTQVAGRVAIAATNGPENTVISGDETAVDAVLARLAASGIAARRLSVSHAFHSPLVEPMLDAFEKEAARVQPAPARLVMASNLTGRIAGADFSWNAAYWRRHARERVRFADGIAALYEQGSRVFVEVGPQPTLVALARTVAPAADVVWLPSLQRGTDGWRTLGRSVAELYARGVSIDWAGFDRGFRRHKVSLPSYPFQRERFWVDPPSVPAPPEPKRAAAVLPLYNVEWIPAAAAPDADKVATLEWTLLADRGGVARAVHDEVVRRGGRSILVARDQSWAGADAASSAAILDFSPLDIARVEDVPVALEDLARVFAKTGPGTGIRPRLWIVTRGAQAAGGAADPVVIEQAPVWGFARVAALEHPDRWGGLIDLDPTRPPHSQVEALTAAVLAGDGEDQIAWRRGQRLVARLRPKATAASGPLSLSNDAAYLITGGTGGLGLQVARRFVDRGARHLVLLSRSGLPPRDVWSSIDPSSAEGTAIAAIRALEGAGAEVTVARGDAAIADDIAHVLAEIDRSGRPLRGVVHAAGIVRQSPVEAATSDHIAGVLQSKTIGTVLLDAATRDRTLDFFVMFSSVSAVWGSKGLAAYAAANQFLDAFGHWRRSQGRPALVVDWGPWADAGMTTTETREWLAQLGLDTIAPGEGLDVLEALMQTGASHAVAARVDWPRFVAVYAAAARRPLLEDLVAANQVAIAASPAPDTETSDVVGAIRAADAAARPALVRELLLEQVARVLRLPQVSGSRALTDLGIDSLMAIELRNEIQRSLGVLVPMVSFLNGSTVDAMAAAIAASLADQANQPTAADGMSPAGSAARLTGAEAEALLGRVHELSEAEVDALLNALGAAEDAR